MSILLQLVQNGSTVSDSLSSAAPVDTGGALDVLKLIWKGGIVMIPIGILFVIAIYLCIERYLTIKKAGKLDDKFMGGIKEMVIEGDLKGAQRLCHDKATPIALMIEKGLSRIGKPLKDISEAVENVVDTVKAVAEVVEDKIEEVIEGVKEDINEVANENSEAPKETKTESVSDKVADQSSSSEKKISEENPSSEEE